MSFTPSENPITNPTRESYTELKPFRFWCQKVLPLVYDDSLSYYELLCKVVDYLNKTMEDVDNMNTDMDTLYSNFQEFQEGTFRIYNELVDYVNTYFDELDVQEEIDNKLDAMVTSGELVTILQPSIADEVSTWLSEHLTPTSPTIDNTLTVSGAGADAKVTGDYIRKFGFTYDSSIKGPDLYKGFYSNDGVFVANDSYFATSLIPYDFNSLSKSSETRCRLMLWNDSKEAVDNIAIDGVVTDYYIPNCSYFCVWGAETNFTIEKSNMFKGYLTNADVYNYDNTYNLSDFIDVTKINYITRGEETSVTFHYYDGNKNLIGYETLTGAQFKINSKYKYFRFFTHDTVSLRYISDGTIINFSNGFITSNGTYVPDESYICSDYIPNDLITKFVFDGTKNYHIHLFDKYYNHISTYALECEGNVFNTINNAYYIRVWCQAPLSFGFVLTGKNNIYDLPVTFMDGYIDNQGVLFVNTNYNLSNYIPCHEVKAINKMDSSEYGINVDYFDENFNYVGWGNRGTRGSIKIKNYKYFRFWFNKNLTDYEVVYNKDTKITIFGDSWSDNNPEHTTYTKWTELIKNNYNAEIFAQNGSSITGNTPSYGENGNILGQINQYLNSPNYSDVFIFMCGINDYRSGVAKESVATKLLEHLNTIKTLHPSARIIYINNHQLFIDANQIKYFNYIRSIVRENGYESYSMNGWIPTTGYIDDKIHPNNIGYKYVYDNIMSILNGGSPKTIKSMVHLASASLNDQNIYLCEEWVNDLPVYTCYDLIPNTGLGNTYNYSITNNNTLLACVNFVLHLFKKGLNNVAQCYIENSTSMTEFSTISTMNLIIITPSSNTGAYLTDNYIEM